MSLLFSLIEWHFFMDFHMPFHFFKVPLDFASLPKPGFCKDKEHRGTPKRRKNVIFFSLIEGNFLNLILHAISFFQTPLRFSISSKTSILQG